MSTNLENDQKSAIKLFQEDKIMQKYGASSLFSKKMGISSSGLYAVKSLLKLAVVFLSRLPTETLRENLGLILTRFMFQLTLKMPFWFSMMEHFFLLN